MRITVNRPTLEQLANRVDLDRRLLEQHPEHSEMLTRKIRRDEKLILNCAIKNKRRLGHIYA